MKKHFLPLALGGLGIGTTEFMMMGLLPDIAGDFRISIPQAGHFISAYALGVVIGAPLLVVAGRNVAPKKMLIALMAVFTVFNSMSAFAVNPAMMLAARFLSGLPHGAFFGVGSVVASRLASKGKEAQAISIMFAGLTVANLLTVPLETWIGHQYSWRYTFGSVGLVGLITIAALYYFMPVLGTERAGNLKSELKVFYRPEPWLILLITGIGTGGLFCWLSYISPLMTEVSHFSAGMVPYVMLVVGLGMVVGNAVGGLLADKVNPVMACLILLLAMSAGLLTIFFTAGNQLASIVMTFVCGSFSVAIAAPIQILMINSTRGAEMLGASATQAAFNIANALGAFLGGLPLMGGFGYSSPVLVGVAMAIAGAGFAYWLLRRTQQANAGMVAAERATVAC